MTTPAPLTTDEVAARLKVHKLTVQRWLREGVIHGTKYPGKAGWRVAVKEVERFEAQGAAR